MNQQLTTAEGQEVSRPLHVLVPLIKKDLELGAEASERAGMPYYEAAGQKLLEAKGQIKHGEFGPWVKRNFDRSLQQAERYMGLARATLATQNQRTREFSSINEALRHSGHSGYTPNKPRPQAWHEPVKEALGKVNVETLNQRRDALKRADERDVERKLAMQLIDIGYKALATKLHPDKGGSRDAMARLNRVRDRLRQSA